jgi:mannose-1-phosphate guanylyltransferase
VKAVVLVGGEGTRLRPLTLHTPKQMLRVIGFPMLERVLQRLRAAGVDEAILSLGYKPDAFRAAYPSAIVDGVRLSYVVEEQPLDTAGAIRFASDQAGISDTFLVVNGDVLTDLDVVDLIAFHRERGAEATIGLVEVADPSQFGVVVTDDDGRALRFVEKPSAATAPSREINAGVYVLEPSALAQVPVGSRASIERQVFPELVSQGRLYARSYRCYWLDAGTPQNYYRAVRDILLGARASEPIPSWGRMPVPGQPPNSGASCYLGSAVRIADGATVAGSVIEDGAEIADGATVVDSVVLEGARIGRDAVVRNSIIGSETELPERVRLERLAVVARSSTLTPGAHLAGAGVP